MRGLQLGQTSPARPAFHPAVPPSSSFHPCHLLNVGSTQCRAGNSRERQRKPARCSVFASILRIPRPCSPNPAPMPIQTSLSSLCKTHMVEAFSLGCVHPGLTNAKLSLLSNLTVPNFQCSSSAGQRPSEQTACPTCILHLPKPTLKQPSPPSLSSPERLCSSPPFNTLQMQPVYDFHVRFLSLLSCF